MTREEIDYMIEVGDVVALSDPEYNSAIVGVTVDNRLVYNYDRIARVLVEDDDMEYEDACEFIDYNIIRALPYMGESSPIVMMIPEEDVCNYEIC